MHQYRNSEFYHPVPSILFRKKHDGKLLKYDVLKEIGKGGFGIVYSAIEYPSKMKVALKCTPKWRLENPKIKQKLINEMTIHRSLDNPNIVKFLGTFHDEYYIYFILELCENGNVLEYIKNYNSTKNREQRYSRNFYKASYNSNMPNDQFNSYLPECEVIKITRQILKALDYLHINARVIHRDIKLQNFLMASDGTVKLSDFGLCIKFEDVSDKSSVISICGTPNYISPEVIDRDSHTSAVDIWGVGVIVFLMLTGQRPFKSFSNKKTFERIRHVHYDWPSYPIVSEQAKSFVDSILKKNPLERPSALKLLKHPFLCLNEDNPSNKKAYSFDSSIKFKVPNSNLSYKSTSTYVSSTPSNATSNRSSSISPSVLSTNSNNNSNSPIRNLNTVKNPNYKSQNISSSPSDKPNYATSYSKKAQNRSKSPSRPLNHNNMISQNMNTLNLQKRSLSPSQPFISNCNSPEIQKTAKEIPSKHCSILTADTSPNSVKPRSKSPTPTTKINLPNQNHQNYPKNPFFSSREGKTNNVKLSQMIIPDVQPLDIHEEIWWEEYYWRLQKNKNNERKNDMKYDQSSSIIIKATIETIEDAAKQAQKVKRSAQNDSKQTGKISTDPSTPTSQKRINRTLSPSNHPKPIKSQDKQTLLPSSEIQLNSNKNDTLDYRIDYGIIPSPHSSAFPSCSVLLWWDYSSRYGLGYIFYNGCVGVCFNDLSRIIMEPTERFAQFYSKPNSKMEIIKLEDYYSDTNEIPNKDQHDAANNNHGNSKSNTNNNQIDVNKLQNDNDQTKNKQSNNIKSQKDPKDAHVESIMTNCNKPEIIDQKADSINIKSSFALPNKKKILIVKHFAKNLKKIAMKHINSNIDHFHEDSDTLFEKMKNEPLDYVKYWGTNKKDGILFKMNGKSLQASFTDKTSLYICADSKNVIYDDTNIVYKVALRDIVGNNKLNSIQSKFLIAKELGKNLE